ncbi:hypothetical protein [Segatella maculosa]|nr:hypothetical protein [Segatella maculosa]
MYLLLKYLIDKMWNSYCMFSNEHYSIAVTVLTALLTGGFLMLFIENRHIGDNVVNRYHFIMTPFMHRLSNFFKFISSAKIYYVINRADKEVYVHDFKSLLDKMGKYAHPCIMSGQDYPCSKFSAQELEMLCDDINRIWYYWDDKHNYMQGHYVYETDRAERFATLGHEYLKEVFPKEFDGEKFSMALISDVSGKFYTDVWQPIQHVPFQYEYWQKKDHKFKELSIFTICTSLITLALILLLRYLLPMWIPTLLVIICMASLGYTLFEMIKLDDLSKNIFR